MIPRTVPSRPTNGLMFPVVAKNGRNDSNLAICPCAICAAGAFNDMTVERRRLAPPSCGLPVFHPTAIHDALKDLGARTSVGALRMSGNFIEILRLGETRHRTVDLHGPQTLNTAHL